ncbi:MAG: hypothetical protein K9M82_01500 [Deltaproteobacteria bacterium]|nr:hypothetical protein [Deltaproteobacteria bacterium]
MLRIWRFITLLLAALGLTLGAAHVLELPPRMQYDAEMYAADTFGGIGARAPRWEYGHAAAFAAWLTGFILLLSSVLMETPADRSRDDAAQE